MSPSSDDLYVATEDSLNQDAEKYADAKQRLQGWGRGDVARLLDNFNGEASQLNQIAGEPLEIQNTFLNGYLAKEHLNVQFADKVGIGYKEREDDILERPWDYLKFAVQLKNG